MAARDAGDLDGARASLDAALAIDSGFSPARMLRESLPVSAADARPPEATTPVASKPVEPPTVSADKSAAREARRKRRRIDRRLGVAHSAIGSPCSSDATPALEDLVVEQDAALPVTVSAADARPPTVTTPVAPKPVEPPTVSTDKSAIRKARTKRRRIDQRIGVAHSAIGSRRSSDATPALEDLVVEQDAALPAIREIAAKLVSAQAAIHRHRLFLSVGAASAVVGVALGLAFGWGTYVPPEPAQPIARAQHETAVTQPSGPTPSASARVAPPQEPSQESPAPVSGAATQPGANSELVARVPPVTAGAIRDVPPDDAPPSLPIVESPAIVRPAASGTPAVSSAPAAVSPEAAAGVTVAVATTGLVIDDAALIRDALHRYRRAYNDLDARLAHAVYPGVDETALAHAFDALSSQSLEFDSCTLDTQQDSARALCRGYAHYVPKVGSRAPRVEPRVWAFRLNKNNGEWTITSAWTDR